MRIKLSELRQIIREELNTMKKTKYEIFFNNLLNKLKIKKEKLKNLPKGIQNKLYQTIENYWRKEGKLKEYIDEELENDTNKIIDDVYKMLQNRKIHPSGEFDGGGRFYLTHDDLVNVRRPSRSWPYSQMIAGRTKKYVKKVCEKYKCKTKQELLKYI